MAVVEIKSTEQFEQLIDGSKPVAAFFTAEWSGPCRAIAPYFKRLAENTPTVVFVTVDVDKLTEVARRAGISAMPAFQTYWRGQKVAEATGANPQGLKDLVESAAQAASA